MKDLMVHVERIVRPVVAGEAMKLRMRRELLAHLVSAVEQERADAPTGAAAVERAKQRLGDPDDLRRQLQSTVPRLHRLMLADVPLLAGRPAVDAGPRDPFAGGPMAHFALLIVPCLLPVGVALLTTFAVLDRLPAWPPRPTLVHPRLLVAIAALAVGLSTGPSIWFCRAVVTIGKRVHPWVAIGSALVLICLQATLAWCLTEAFGEPARIVPFLAWSTGGSLLLVALMVACMRWFSRLRQPYADWTTLDLSGAAEAAR